MKFYAYIPRSVSGVFHRICMSFIVVVALTGCTQIAKENFGYGVEQALFGQSTPTEMETVDGKLVTYSFRLLPGYRISHKFWWGFYAEQCHYPFETARKVWVSNEARGIYRNYQLYGGLSDIYELDGQLYGSNGDEFTLFHSEPFHHGTCAFNAGGGAREINLTLVRASAKTINAKIEYLVKIYEPDYKNYTTAIKNERRGTNTWTVLEFVSDDKQYVHRTMFLPISKSSYYELHFIVSDGLLSSARYEELNEVIDSFTIELLTPKEKGVAENTINEKLRPWLREKAEKWERERPARERRNREKRERELADEKRRRDLDAECAGIIVAKPKCWWRQ